jgi:hypothetical protein
MAVVRVDLSTTEQSVQPAPTPAAIHDDVKNVFVFKHLKINSDMAQRLRKSS